MRVMVDSFLIMGNAGFISLYHQPYRGLNNNYLYYLGFGVWGLGL